LTVLRSIRYSAPLVAALAAAISFGVAFAVTRSVGRREEGAGSRLEIRPLQTPLRVRQLDLALALPNLALQPPTARRPRPVLIVG
jgi:hypothetical protein